jgi:thiamine biosynthesis lipoprotein
MGTGYSIKLYAPAGLVTTELQAAVDARLEAINDMMSTYRPNSDLMRFNHNTSTDWQPVPAPLAELVAQSIKVSEQSGGRYDITVGPLVNIWGFGNLGPTDEPPTDAAIAAALERVGYQRLAVRLDPPALRKQVAQLEIDLSSIAKGWGVDQIAQLLEARGVTSYLVDIGGEVRARGYKPDGAHWRIAIERPLREGRAVERVLSLDDMAMATSGDYRNYFRVGEDYYSHTLDPRSGRPVRHHLASVSVIADDCASADAWATALLALGEQEGPALATQLGLKAFFIIRTASGFEEQATPAYEKFTAQEPAA